MNGRKFKERDEKILKLWAKNKSASQIALELGLASRNVVIGVANRARERGDKRAISRYVPPPRRKHASSVTVSKPKRLRAPQPRNLEPPKPTPKTRPKFITVDGGVPLWDLQSGMCHWPLWGKNPVHIEDKRYCGATAKENSSYCEHCYALCYIPGSAYIKKGRRRAA